LDKEKTMNRELKLIASAGVGATFMYLLDPERGRRRRALLRDKLVSATRKAPRAIEVTARDLANRAQGLVAEAAAKITRDETPDEKIVARVRSELGKVVSHPGAIEVTAEDGSVRLTGHVLADEVDDLLAAVSAVPGVREVGNRLEVHETPDKVPALQGGKPHRRNSLDFLKRPAVCALTTAVGVALIIPNLKRKALTSTINNSRAERDRAQCH
jgi:hypothetical protein